MREFISNLKICLKTYPAHIFPWTEAQTCVNELKAVTISPSLPKFNFPWPNYVKCNVCKIKLNADRLKFFWCLYKNKFWNTHKLNIIFMNRYFRTKDSLGDDIFNE